MSGTCDVCGNEYEHAFSLTTAQGATYTFDSFECAIHKVAPVCAHCGCVVIGHGIQAHEQVYCCAHCADVHGVRNVSDNSEHVPVGSPAPPDGGPTGGVAPGAMSSGPMPTGPIPPGSVPPEPGPMQPGQGAVPPGQVPPIGS